MGKPIESSVVRSNRHTWVAVIWEGLESHRENCIAGREYDDEWDDICTAMAWVAEKLGVPENNFIHSGLACDEEKS